MPRYKVYYYRTIVADVKARNKQQADCLARQAINCRAIIEPSHTAVFPSGKRVVVYTEGNTPGGIYKVKDPRPISE